MAPDNDTVRYKEIPGHPGYRVGDDGTVWSRWQKISKGKAKGFTHFIGDGEWRRLAPNTDSRQSGHLRIRLVGGRRIFVHRLVLETFVGPCPPRHVACHFPDRNPANNRLENLRWGTQEANRSDSVKHGTAICGEKTRTAKLTEHEVRQIRSEYAEGKTTQQQLADRYRVGLTTIWFVVNRGKWKHVK